MLIYLSIYLYIWAPVKILYMWLVATVIVIAFGGAYRFPGFCGYQHIRDPTWSQKPILNRLGNASRSCFVGFRCFGNNSCSFHFCINLHACSSMFLSFACIFFSFCIHFPSFSFHSPFMFLSFVIIFFIFLSYIPFVFIPMCIHVLSSSFFLLFNLQACSFHFAFISFDFLSKVMEMALRLGQGPNAINDYR